MTILFFIYIVFAFYCCAGPATELSLALLSMIYNMQNIKC